MNGEPLDPPGWTDERSVEDIAGMVRLAIAENAEAAVRAAVASAVIQVNISEEGWPVIEVYTEAGEDYADKEIRISELQGWSVDIAGTLQSLTIAAALEALAAKIREHVDAAIKESGPDTEPFYHMAPDGRLRSGKAS